MHAYDILNGGLKYLRWQHTWWSGVYSIVLTKAAIVHRDYLTEFQATTPTTVLEYIDSNRNCEDLALAHLIAKMVSALILLLTHVSL